MSRSRIAGLTDPAITVPAGAQVSIDVINADPDTAHGLVITASGTASSPMPMLTARPAFPGSAVWFLGNPTPAGMHAATLDFTASTPGTYRYLCPVPDTHKRHDRNVHRQRHRKHDPPGRPWLAETPPLRLERPGNSPGPGEMFVTIFGYGGIGGGRS